MQGAVTELEFPVADSTPDTVAVQWADGAVTRHSRSAAMKLMLPVV